jgi:hypothetical protein
MVWVDRALADRPNALQTELLINGKLVDIFSSDTQKAVDRHLQKGWNTIVLKTLPKADALQPNQLVLSFGVTRPGPKKNQLEMDPILWVFRNGANWQHRDGKFVSTLGGEVKEVTQTFKVWYAGPAQESGRLHIKDGDYVLTAESREFGDVPVLATVWINGTALSTFVGNKRNVVVTPLLKAGKNELKLATARVKDSTANNDIRLQLVGPARLNAEKKTHEFPIVKELTTAEDWQRDAKTGRVTNRTEPEADAAERTITFVLDEGPRAAGQ